MKLAANPMSAIDNVRPKINTTGCSRAAPATANTLSSDIETSAITICHVARAKDLRGAEAATVPSAWGLLIRQGIGRILLVAMR